MTATPVISIVPGGYRVHIANIPSVYGTGASLPDALQALSAAIAGTYDTEKGDETAEARDAGRRTDILDNDRFIRGNQLQNTILLGVALGL
jgi:predicted RNase H-like HicB family nuclease